MTDTFIADSLIGGRQLFSRRAALRLALTAVPASAGLIWAGSSSAGAAASSSIEIIDAISQSSADRSGLVPGSYCPGPTTTGPLPGRVLRRVDGDFFATANGQVIENLEVFGGINTRSFSNVVIRNCVVWGTTAIGTDIGFITMANDDGRGLLIEDSKFIGRDNAWLNGMRGGNYTIRRSEISNSTDGIALTSALGNVTVEACWIHNCYYVEWAENTPGYRNTGNYYIHADGVQFHRGRNYTIRGNMIGGTRFPAAHHTGYMAEINAADDMYNSAFMIKQEVDNTYANKIENVLIEKNWLMGGAATVNITTGRDNDFSSLIFRNNRFMRSTWGTQIYILRGAGLGQFSNNVFDDNGAAVPISNGY